MSQILLESTKSQYSFLDQNLSIYSTSSKNRKGKYFTRKPIQTYSPRVASTQRKHRDCSDFIGFYSPTHKNQALTQRNIYQKALKNDLRKYKNTFSTAAQDDNKSHSSSYLQVKSSSRDEIMQIDNLPKKSFRKKKPQFLNSAFDKVQNSERKQLMQFEKKPSFFKQNPQKTLEQLTKVMNENINLKKDLLELKQANIGLQMKIDKLTKYIPLQQQINQLKIQLASSIENSHQLQSQIQIIKAQQTITIKTLESIYTQSLQSFIQHNSQLKVEVYNLQQNLKYAGIEISILRKSERNQVKENKEIVEERNMFKKQNKQLKNEIQRLKQVRQREKEMWKEWEQREQVQFSISDSERSFDIEQ